MVQESSAVCSHFQAAQLLAKRATVSSKPQTSRSAAAPRSPICRLPPEALCEIFLQCHSKWDPHLPDARQPILFVSKYWRSVALGCPKLWDAIVFPTAELPHCPRWFRHLTYKQLLRVGRGVLVSLWAAFTDAGSFSRGVNEDELAAVCKILGFVEGEPGVGVSFKALGVAGRETARRFLKCIRASSVAKLKTFSLDIGQNKAGYPVESYFRGSTDLELQSLTILKDMLGYLWFPWITAHVRKDCLVSLRLEDRQFPTGGTPDDALWPHLYPLLQHVSGSLEDLHLDLGNALPAMVEVPGPPAAIDLYKLRELTLVGPTAQIVSFFEYTRIPGDAFFNFTARIDDPLSEEGIDRIFGAYLTSSGVATLEPNFLTLGFDVLGECERFEIVDDFVFSISLGFFNENECHAPAHCASGSSSRPLISGELRIDYDSGDTWLYNGKFPYEVFEDRTFPILNTLFLLKADSSADWTIPGLSLAQLEILTVHDTYLSRLYYTQWRPGFTLPRSFWRTLGSLPNLRSLHLQKVSFYELLLYLEEESDLLWTTRLTWPFPVLKRLKMVDYCFELDREWCGYPAGWELEEGGSAGCTDYAGSDDEDGQGGGHNADGAVERDGGPGGRGQVHDEGWFVQGPEDYLDSSSEVGSDAEEDSVMSDGYWHEHAVPENFSTYPVDVLTKYLTLRQDLGYPVEYVELESCFDVTDEDLEVLAGCVGELKVTKIRDNPCLRFRV